MERQRRTYTDPIQVDAELLDSMRRLLREAEHRVLALACPQEGITVREYRGLKAKPASLKEDHYQRLVVQRIDQIVQPNLTVVFDDGSSIEDTNIDEVEAELTARSVEAKELSLSIGRSSILKVDVSIEKSRLSSAYSLISGTRADVRDFDKMVMDMLANAEPPHSILYRRNLQAIYIMVAFPIMIVLYEASRTVLAQRIPGYVLGSSSWYNKIPAGIVMLIVMVITLERYEKIFPLTSFAFGRTFKRRKTAQVLVWNLITVVFLPILLSLVNI